MFFMETDSDSPNFDSKFDWKQLVGYLVLVGAVTGVIIYSLKLITTSNTYTSLTKEAHVKSTSVPKDVVAEDSNMIENSSTVKSMQEDVTELKIEDQVIGTGDEAVSGKTISVHYTGTLTDGTKFDSSKDRGTPFEFVLGAGKVIQGWDKGFAGMRVGGVRKLIIPSDMGYGSQGAGGVIPPNATLIFEVELLEVK